MDPSERCRRLLDLFLVSVLLDAGAGNSWSYKSKENGRTYKRSEGLAIASLEMFKDGLFSSDRTQPHQVDSTGLKGLTLEKMTAGLQVSASNPIAGLEGRTGLLLRLSEALHNEQLFGMGERPGNMLGKSAELYHSLLTCQTTSSLTPQPKLLQYRSCHYLFSGVS